jgi:ribosomal protein S18 acetylase RimI-like enzyme
MKRFDNPIWAALTTRHARFALGSERLKRYPREIGPFIAVSDANARVDAELRELVAPGESVDFVARRPPLPPDWSVQGPECVLQMMCEQAIAADGSVIQPPSQPVPPWVRLTDADRAAMLELTALVYPLYFRERTQELGPYVGIWQDGMLAAMAGERMAMDDHVEISAVCTHPRFLGRGYAAALIGVLVNDIRARGLNPFLHVSDQNTRAIALYERLGFVTHARLEMWMVTRPA